VAYRCRRFERFAFDCPAAGAAARLWGIDLYTDDSSLCSAAVHAGEITLAAGGRITIEMRPGESRYFAITRNGISSLSLTTPAPCSFVLYPW